MTSRGQAVSIGGGRTSPPIITIILPGFIGPVDTDVTNTWFRVPAGGLDLTNATVHIVAKQTAGGSNPSWDIMRSTDHGSTFTTILPSGAANKLQLTTGVHYIDLTPAWTVTTLDEGDLLRVDVVATDSSATGADIVITIELQQ